LADVDQPLVNSSFTYGEMPNMTIAGMTYGDGISTYPFSEIVYPLKRSGLRFTAGVGVTDDSAKGAGSVRFVVYGDEFILWSSGVVRAGQPAQEVDISVEGIEQLRLVVDDAGDGSLGDYALWAQPRLLLTDGEPSAAALEAIANARAEQQQKENEYRAAERRAIDARAGVYHAALVDLGAVRPQTQAAYHSATEVLTIGNDQIAATLGFGGASNGRISVFRRGADVPVLLDATPAVTTADGRTLRLADLLPRRTTGYAIRPAEDLILGPGLEIRASYRATDPAAALEVTLTVFDGDPAVGLRITSEGVALRSVDYVGAAGSAVLLGEDVQYLSDRSHLYTGVVIPDGYTRRAALEATKPALLWSDRTQRGMLFSFFDYVPAPAWLEMRRDPGAETVTLGLELAASLNDFGPQGTTPPALTIQVIEGPVGLSTFERFRRIVRARYPEAPWPPGLKYQWGTWYVFGPGVSAQLLRPQMERLAARFGDLGRWQVILDAGWHKQYGNEEAELGTVDQEKFPQGVRAIADEAHRRGMDLVLYLGTGFIHDSQGDGGEWLALRGLIERHPEWMIPFQHEATNVRRYLLDYRNPEVEAYVRAVVRDYFLVHGVDGIVLDGLADAEGQFLPRAERDRPQGPPNPLLPTLDIYRMIWDEAVRHHPSPFVESSWLNPTAANPYNQVFRYGDESDAVHHPYPFNGFLQRLDYTIFGQTVLGQRTYVGTALGDPNRAEMRWWVQAAAALGADATLSFDLARLTPERAAAFRADLIAMDPFRGTTRYGPGLFPDTFASTRDSVTYLGVVNRDPSPREVVVSPAALGLTGASYAAFDAQAERARRVDGDFGVAMPGRSFRLFVLRPDEGVLWTDSSLEVEPRDNGLAITARGPSDVPGYIYVATPPPAAVLLDGRPLQPSTGAAQEGQYAYDAAAGVLTVRYAHGSGRRIEVQR
jgi:hypothetical protein